MKTLMFTLYNLKRTLILGQYSLLIVNSLQFDLLCLVYLSGQSETSGSQRKTLPLSSYAAALVSPQKQTFKTGTPQEQGQVEYGKMLLEKEIKSKKRGRDFGDHLIQSLPLVGI